MVFFTCSSCGSSLKKNKVDQHLQHCKHAEYLTCIDCSKDFGLYEYQSHISCITEDEKYGAVGTKQKPTKGSVKQRDLMKKIETLVTERKDLPRQSLLILQQLQTHSNMPYKKGKFMNFIKNALNVRNSKLVEEIWNLVFDKSVNHFSDCSTRNSTDTSTPKKIQDVSSQNINPSTHDDKPEEKSLKEVTKYDPTSVDENTKSKQIDCVFDNDYQGLE